MGWSQTTGAYNDITIKGYMVSWKGSWSREIQEGKTKGI